MYTSQARQESSTMTHGSRVSPGPAPQPRCLPRAAQGARTDHCTCKPFPSLMVCDSHAHYRACLSGSGCGCCPQEQPYGKPRVSPTAEIQSWEAPAAAAKRQKLPIVTGISSCTRVYELIANRIISITHNKNPYRKAMSMSQQRKEALPSDIKFS